jgi:hypothetical protein
MDVKRDCYGFSGLKRQLSEAKELYNWASARTRQVAEVELDDLGTSPGTGVGDDCRDGDPAAGVNGSR